MSDLQIGLSAPDDLGRFDPDAQRAALAAIADAGIDHVFTADHVSFIDGSGIDGPVRLAALGALEPRLGLHLGVMLLALRHPLVAARQIATLAEYAPGRVSIGVGVGGEDRHEFEVCEVDPATAAVAPMSNSTLFVGSSTARRSTATASFSPSSKRRSARSRVNAFRSSWVGAATLPSIAPVGSAMAGWRRGAHPVASPRARRLSSRSVSIEMSTGTTASRSGPGSATTQPRDAPTSPPGCSGSTACRLSRSRSTRRSAPPTTSSPFSNPSSKQEPRR